MDKWQGLIKQSLLDQGKGLVMLPDSFKKGSDMIRLTFFKKSLVVAGWRRVEVVRPVRRLLQWPRER